MSIQKHSTSFMQEPKQTHEQRAPLYREQAVSFAGSRQYGTVVIKSPPAFRVLTIGACGVVASLIAFVLLCSTSRKVHCQGLLLPTSGVVKILAPSGGIVTKNRLVEGQVVNEGEHLVTVSSERSSADVAQTQHTVSSLLKERLLNLTEELQSAMQLGEERKGALRRKVYDISAELTQIRGQVELQRNRVRLSEATFERYRGLEGNGYVSSAHIEEKFGDLLDQRQRLAEYRRQEVTALRELKLAESASRDLSFELKRQALTLQREYGRVKQELTDSEAQRALVVRAPLSGVITATTSHLGQAVHAQQRLASLIPNGTDLQAEIYAPSRSVGFIRPGMKVLLRYQAYPYQKFGQHSSYVVDIARTAVAPEELPFSAAGMRGTEPLYRVRLALDKQSVNAYGHDVLLKSGMLVEASVIVEHRRLYEWILDPLFSITGRV